MRLFNEKASALDSEAFRKGLAETGLFEGTLSRSSLASRTVNLIDCQPWRLNWFGGVTASLAADHRFERVANGADMRLRYALIENRVKAVSVCSRGSTSRK